MDDLLSELNSIKDESITLELDIGAINGLKKMPVDIFDGVYLSEAHNNALILCIDVRNFSDFFCSQTDDNVFMLIKEFTLNLLSCINHFGYGCSYYKFLGDGVLVIWDKINEDAINEALDIFYTYSDFANEDLFKPYKGLGLGGALVEEKVFKYEISAELSQLKYRDYIGYGINLACRLQSLAGVNELILNNRIATTRSLPFRVDESPEKLKELHLFKGLLEDDRKRALYYDRKTSNSSISI